MSVSQAQYIYAGCKPTLTIRLMHGIYCVKILREVRHTFSNHAGRFRSLDLSERLSSSYSLKRSRGSHVTQMASIDLHHQILRLWEVGRQARNSTLPPGPRAESQRDLLLAVAGWLIASHCGRKNLYLQDSREWVSK